MTKRTVSIKTQERAYDGFFSINRFKIQHSTPDGGMSPEITREVFERGHAAALLAYDPATDMVLVINEFRIGRMAAGLQDDQCWSVGPVAGMIDDDEDPSLCALRELAEEAGIDGSQANLTGPLTVFSSPGGSSEMISLFIAEMPLDETRLTATGNAGEGEFTEPRLIPRTELLKQLFSGPVNGHLTTLILWLEHRLNQKQKEQSA